MREQIEFQIKNGIDGLVPVGTTGESPTVDFDEHERVIELTIKHVAGRIPVIAWRRRECDERSDRVAPLRQEQPARPPGCRSIRITTSRARKGLYAHFMKIADTVDLPIVLYNIPGRTGITMAAATVARLNKHPNIVAIKEATGVPDIASEIRSLCDIPILSGDDSLTLPLMSLGATGVISVASNLVPHQIKKMVTLAAGGNFAEAMTIHHRLFPLIKSLFVDGNPVGVKYAMKVAGFDSGELRLPLVEASESTKKSIEDQVAKLR